MKATAAYQPKEYLPGGAMAAESVPWPFLDSGDIVVTHIAAATGARTILQNGSDYILSGDGRAMLGTVTATAAWPAGDIFRIERATDRAQRNDFDNQENLPAEDLERELDRQSFAIEEQDAAIGDMTARTPQVPPGESAPDFASLEGMADGTLLEYRAGKLRPFDHAPFAGKFFVGDGTGRPVPASGTGSDADLRGDLADPAAGAALSAFKRSDTGAIPLTLADIADALPLTLREFGGGPDKSGAVNRAAIDNALAALAARGGGVLDLGDGEIDDDCPAGHILPAGVTISGRGKLSTVLTRTDNATTPWFKGTNLSSRSAVRGFRMVGNNQAGGYPGADLSGALVEIRQTAAATARCFSIMAADMAFENCKGDGWIAIIQVGNPGYDLIGPRIEGSCDFVSMAGNCRGPNDLAMPQALLYCVGNSTPGSETRLRAVYMGPVFADVPHVKGIALFFCGVDGALVDDPQVERVGTIGIGADKGGYAYGYGNEVLGAPNATNITFRTGTIKAGRACGVYGFNWGGTGGTILIDGSSGYIANLNDTAAGTLPKAAVALTDSDTEVIIRNIEALQCVSAINAPLAAGQRLTIDGVRYRNLKASVSPKPETNVGTGSLVMDHDAPVDSAIAGDWSVTVTSGGGTATPTFTVTRPDATVAGTYTVGGAAFATGLRFTVVNGTINFATGDTFIVHVHAVQPADNSHAIIISKQGGTYNREKSGKVILAGTVDIVNQSAGGDGLVLLTADGGGATLTYGRTEIAADLSIDVLGIGMKIWGAAEASPGPLIPAFPDGLKIACTGTVVSTGRTLGFVMRALSSAVDFGGSLTVARSVNRAEAAASLFDIQGCQDIDFRPGALTLYGQDQAGDDEAFDADEWDSGTGMVRTKGTIATGAIVFAKCLAAKRTDGASLGTAASPRDWAPPQAQGFIANIAPVAGAPTGWRYDGAAWKAEGIAFGGARAATVADPGGGVTVDAEARTVLSAVIDAMQAAGLMA